MARWVLLLMRWVSFYFIIYTLKNLLVQIDHENFSCFLEKFLDRERRGAFEYNCSNLNYSLSFDHIKLN